MWDSGDGRDLSRAPELVRASWLRSRSLLQDPTMARVRSILTGDELAARRAEHPLSPLLPLVRSLLSAPAQEHGLVMAVGDKDGRLLWVEGDTRMRSLAEDMAFLEGADWSETSMGTSAPGIAAATGAAVQVRREEHFSPLVSTFSCSAVPLTDPRTGERIGFLDLTGDERAADSLVLPYLLATASAVQAHLLALPAERQAEPAEPVTVSVSGWRAPEPAAPPRALLRATGPDAPRLVTATGTTRLSLRHAELLAVLAHSERGLTAEQLADRVYPGDVTAVTLRAEMTRLRRALSAAGVDSVTLTARPYRVSGLDVDALLATEQLHAGEPAAALGAYAGELLPGSEAPEVLTWRQELAVSVRDAVLEDGDLDSVLSYLGRVEAEEDVEAWRTALQLLPPRSPRRAAVVAHLEVLGG